MRLWGCARGRAGGSSLGVNAARRRGHGSRFPSALPPVGTQRHRHQGPSAGSPGGRADAPEATQRPLPADPSPDIRRQPPSQLRRLRAIVGPGAREGPQGGSPADSRRARGTPPNLLRRGRTYARPPASSEATSGNRGRGGAGRCRARPRLGPAPRTLLQGPLSPA